MNAMREVARNPLTPGKPMGFNVVRVPFFLEPDYPTGEEFEETNRVRLLRKWGGQAGWDAQKRRHGMKERGREVGIERTEPVHKVLMCSHQIEQPENAPRRNVASLCA